MNKDKVIVFGVFDGLHHGHQYLLSEAAEHGDELVVVVAPDSIVQELKLKTPRNSLSERIEAIKKTGKAHHVVPGDSELGKWNVLTTHKPSVIVFGHDQHVLREVLEDYCLTLPNSVRFVMLDKIGE